MGREPAQARCLQERVCRRVNHAPAEQKEEPMGIKEFRYDGSQALELNKTPTSLQGLDRDKIQAKAEMKRQLRVLLAKACCKNISSQEVHDMVDEIFAEYE